MSRKFLILLLLLAIMAGTVSAQRGKRAIKRIDREVQETVFIPKGTWMVGGTVSYSEHDESNLNFLVIKMDNSIFIFHFLENLEVCASFIVWLC